VNQFQEAGFRFAATSQAPDGAVETALLVCSSKNSAAHFAQWPSKTQAVFSTLQTVMAERVGFEPTLPFRVNTLSKRAPSATRPSLRATLSTSILTAGGLEYPAPFHFTSFGFFGKDSRSAGSSDDAACWRQV
jgi:hypothetical protein